MSLKILLADDHRIIRDGLRALLHGEPDMHVVAEAENGRATVKLARQHLPDIIILDIGMPDLNGIEAARQILKDNPGARVIALSMHSDKRFVSQMLQVGASGYLPKDCAFEELIQAVRTIQAGRVYLSPEIAGIVVEDYVNRMQFASCEEPSLSPREREVLQLLAEGRTTREVAAELYLSIKTVETHRLQIMNKLGIRSVAELVKYAIRQGLTELDS